MWRNTILELAVFGSWTFCRIQRSPWPSHTGSARKYIWVVMLFLMKLTCFNFKIPSPLWQIWQNSCELADWHQPHCLFFRDLKRGTAFFTATIKKKKKDKRCNMPWDCFKQNLLISAAITLFFSDIVWMQKKGWNAAWLLFSVIKRWLFLFLTFCSVSPSGALSFRVSRMLQGWSQSVPVFPDRKMSFWPQMPFSSQVCSPYFIQKSHQKHKWGFIVFSRSFLGILWIYFQN